MNVSYFSIPLRGRLLQAYKQCVISGNTAKINRNDCECMHHLASTSNVSCHRPGFRFRMAQCSASKLLARYFQLDRNPQNAYRGSIPRVQAKLPLNISPCEMQDLVSQPGSYLLFEQSPSRLRRPSRMQCARLHPTESRVNSFHGAGVEL